MKKIVISACIIMVMLTLAISAFAERSVTLDEKIKAEKADDIHANADGKVRYASYPWLPLLQFEKYRDLFERGK